MDAINHNLDKENKFLELLGYSLMGPNKSSRWTILDSNNKEIGYIQYKKIYKGNKKKNFSKIFGYHTVINSSDINYDSLRKINDVYGRIIDKPDFFYEFDIKRNHRKTTHVELCLGSDFCLSIWDQKYGYMNFRIDYDGLFLNYSGETSNYNFEQTVIYNNNVDDHNQYKKYIYNFSYFDKYSKLSFLDSMGRTTKEISGIFYPYNNKQNELTLFEKTWVDGKLTSSQKTIINGTIEQLAISHKKGIDCFHDFMSLANELIPFKDNIIFQITSNDEKNKDLLSLFLGYDENLEKCDNQKTLIKSSYNNG